MSRYPPIVSPSASREECITHALNKEDHHLLVVSEGVLKGIITKSDLLKKQDSKTAHSISTRKIAVITPEATLYDALEKMQLLGFKQLPVINQGKLIGLITQESAYEAMLKVSPQTPIETNQPVYEGVCDSCGALTLVRPVNDKMVCYQCKN